MKAVLVVVFSLMLFIPASATIINIPDDQFTIQAGINASTSGDTVRVAPGNYVENINFNGRNIVVGSWFLDDGDPSYISSTRIDGSGAPVTVVIFQNGEDVTAVIAGFTIQNGHYDYGGGIRCDDSDPTISNNIIIDDSSSYGGGIYCIGSNPTIINNTITQNSAVSNGGGIFCYDSSPQITNTIFWGNTAPNGPQIYPQSSSSPVITYCDVQGGWTGVGNINCNPMFCDPGNGDFYLHGASCCVGAGAGGDDIGAYGVGCAFPAIILSVTPSQNQLNVAVGTDITVTFDMDMDESTINDSTFVVNARSTGVHTGTITYDGPGRTATLDPTDDFDEGEMVTVTLTTGIKSNEGTPLENPYVWSFISAVNEGPGIFAGQSLYAAGDGPHSVFSADLDGDDDMDLATANYYSDNVSVFLNNGDGTFAAHSVYAVDDGPRSVISADFDGDGDMDLAAIDYYSDNAAILLNNGDGGFAPYSAYSVGDAPWSVYSADLDGDGDMDLAAANLLGDDISVLLNNGDGTFATQTLYELDSGAGPISVFSSVLDGDGDMDLATANYYADSLAVLLNNGDGTFVTDSVYAVNDGPRSVYAADLDGDGDADLAVANANSDNISVLLNDGDGTFAPQFVYAVGDQPRSIFSADIDGDGDLDLATANATSDDISVLMNNGDGSFGPYSAYPVGDSPWSVFSADLDGDGDLDLAAGNYDSDNISVLLNLHHPQIVSTVPEQNELNIPVSTDISVTFDVDLDAATVNDSTFVVNARSTGLHAGTISYDSLTRTAIFSPAMNFDEGEVVSITLTTGIQSSYGTPLENAYVWSFTSAVDDGSGVFASQVTYATANGPHSVFAADLDGDGDLDLATANNVYGSQVSVLTNNGDGTFGAPAVYGAVDAHSNSVFAADLDGDGDLDLATANISRSQVSILLNNGDGTFATPLDYGALDANSFSIFAADLHGDGDLDLATANYYGYQISILLNNGDGTLAAPASYGAVDTNSVSVFAADLDGDGDFDLATTSDYGYQISVLLNNGDGTFTTRQVMAPSMQPVIQYLEPISTPTATSTWPQRIFQDILIRLRSC
jgi:hypothetical protein